MFSAQELSSLTGTSDRTIRGYSLDAMKKGRDTITTNKQRYFFRKQGRSYEFSTVPFKEASMSAEVSLNGTIVSDSNNEQTELSKKTVKSSQDIDNSIPSPAPAYFSDSTELKAYEALDEKERKIVDFKVRLSIEYRAHLKKPRFNSVKELMNHYSDYYRVELEQCGMELKREYFSRWNSIYEIEGNAGFLKKKGRQKGSHSVPDWAVKMLKDLFWSYDGRIRNSLLYRMLNAEAYKRGALSKRDYKRTFQNIKIGGIISLTQIGKITADLKETPEYQYLINPDRFKNGFEAGFGDMSESAEFANHIWEIDSTKLDAFAKDANGISTWSIIAISDRKTRMKVASIVKNSNAQGIAELLFKAFEKLGIPENIVTDNGKDYLSNHIIGLLKRMGVKHIKTAPFAGEQKPFAERHFGTIQNSFTELLNNFKGHSVSEMQAITALTSTPERLSGRTPDKETEHIKDIAMKLDDWIDIVYAHEYNRGLGCTPYESYIEDEHRISRYKMHQMAYAFGERVIRKVSKEDGLSIKTIKYNNAEGKLGAYVKRDVEVAIDMLDSNICYVFDVTTGDYICIATTDQITEAGIKASKLFAKEVKKRAKKLKNDATKSLKDKGNDIQNIIDARADALSDLTPIAEIGGSGFTQNSGNIERVIGAGKQIDADLEVDAVRSESPDVDLLEAMSHSFEEKPIPKLITHETIAEDELREA